MAAFSGFRSWFPLERQAQLASGMLVFGASGALMTSWPVHFFLPYVGWRGVFVAMAMFCCLAIIGLYFGLPQKTKNLNDWGLPPAAIKQSAKCKNIFRRCGQAFAYTALLLSGGI